MIGLMPGLYLVRDRVRVRVRVGVGVGDGVRGWVGVRFRGRTRS